MKGTIAETTQTFKKNANLMPKRYALDNVWV